ncbi:MAG: hypothetical protein J5J00_17480 [Deltaproteobacteria bacterium]|nr:hypothetical protein [Deltaproteobacteria bacterium]
MNANNKRIVLKGIGSISSLGCTSEEERENLTSGETRIRTIEIEGRECKAAPLSPSGETALARLAAEQPRYADLDRSVLMAIYSARQALQQVGWRKEECPVLVNIGSSRGSTGLFEHYHRMHVESRGSKMSPLASPTTTLGNVASWVLQDLKLCGQPLSHSVTCSTGIQAIANGVAWLRSGMVWRALVGGSEAPLTSFTISQMRALKVYATESGPLPCRPCAADPAQGTGMVLGEGAAVHALELKEAGQGEIIVEGVGLSSETIDSPTSISERGDALQTAMRAALEMAGSASVDAVLMHAPGTPFGDTAELAAIEEVFGEDRRPMLISNKWIIGHTFGAAGSLALNYAILLLNGTRPVEFPYRTKFSNLSRPIKRVMVNAAGFGGNAGSAIIARL